MRRFLSYPHVVSTLALLVALSGGAYAAGLVGTSDLKDGAVTTAKLHRHAVSEAKLAKALARTIDRAGDPPRAIGAREPSIAQIGPVTAPLLTVTLPRAGDYLVTGSLRAFSKADNPGHNLNCFFDVAGAPFLNNVWVELNKVENLPLTGLLTTTAADQPVSLNCQQIMGDGQITASYDLVFVPVRG